MKVFLTGATGYLGGELLRQLTLAGHHVRALVREPGRLESSHQVEPCLGDLSDTHRLAAMMSGSQVIFHSAAVVATWLKDESEFYRTNHQGLLKVMAAFEKARAQTLVYTSSFFALGSAPSPGVVEDSAPSASRLHPYQHSKFLAREEARMARAAGFPIVILYPGVIYGPGRRTQGNLVARLIADFLEGRVPGLPGSGRQEWSYAYIEDVARGHLLAAEKAPSGGEYVLGGENVRLEDFFKILARLVGRCPPRFRIPVPVAAFAGAMEFWIARMRRRVPQISAASVRLMCRDWACNSSRAGAQICYRFRSLEQGLHETLRSMNIPVLDCKL